MPNATEKQKMEQVRATTPNLWAVPLNIGVFAMISGALLPAAWLVIAGAALFVLGLTIRGEAKRQQIERRGPTR